MGGWLLLALFMVQATCSIATLEFEIFQQFKEEVRFTKNEVFSIFWMQWTTVIEKIINYEQAVHADVETIAKTLEEDTNIVIDTFKEYQVNLVHCREHIQGNLRLLGEESRRDIKVVIQNAWHKWQRIFSNVNEVFNIAENKTVEVEREMQSCAFTNNLDECYFETTQKFLFIKNTIPSIIDVALDHYERQLQWLEESVINSLDSALNKIHVNDNELLDEFLLCALQFY